jgi:hypothetical protein
LQGRTFCRRLHLNNALAREVSACHLVDLMSRYVDVDW